MANSWDRPPIPSRGDENQDTAYAYVGRIISRWEAIEFELSRLHSCFAGAPDEQEPVAEYGRGTIFRQRVEILNKGAEAFFVTRCDQKRESQFDTLLKRAKGYADRRNDIAHGILFRIDQLTYFRQRMHPNLLNRAHYAVIPPLYVLRWHKTGLPDFCYSSAEMSRLLLRLEKLHMAIEKFRLALMSTS